MLDPSFFDPSTARRIQSWLDGPFDEKTKNEIRNLIKTDPTALRDAFYTTLAFGTGGMRGIMGPGTNRMNQYTIQIATQGLANVLKRHHPHAPLSVFIGFDNRHQSSFFALKAAEVLAGNNITAYVCSEMRPTPFVSFACRHLRCNAAIMITASHNPKEYNGFKVYWNDGAQVVFPYDEEIVKEVSKITSINDVRSVLNPHPLIRFIDGTQDNAYLDAVAHIQNYEQIGKKEGKNLKVIFTGLHGTGSTLMVKALRRFHFTQVDQVESQIDPSGDFPTVKSPNPESKEALLLGIALLKEKQGDLLIATDPDADRIGLAILQGKTPYIFNGNEIATLCVEHLCRTLLEQNRMPKKGAIITTIVTTPLLKTIASAYGVACFEVLTGFKYIGERIRQWEESPDGYQFIFGAEESYGYLCGTYARDKDGIGSGCLLCEIALMAKLRGETLHDQLISIYRRYGVCREKQRSIDFPAGKAGLETINSQMGALRKNPLKTLGKNNVVQHLDYLKGIDGLPKSNVITLVLDDDSKLVIRPSGTEPKIKIYAAVFQKDGGTVEKMISSCDQKLDHLLNEMAAYFNS